MLCKHDKRVEHTHVVEVFEFNDDRQRKHEWSTEVVRPKAVKVSPTTTAFRRLLAILADAKRTTDICMYSFTDTEVCVLLNC